MWTSHAERLVAREPSAVRAAIAELVGTMWDRRTWTVADTGDERIDAVATDPCSDDADVWLTWRTAARPDGTWVGLQLDELDEGPDPGDGLAGLLDRLVLRLGSGDLR